MNNQAANEKRTERRAKQGPKNVIHLNGTLACQRCANSWDVVDLNPERKVVECPICAELNDIKSAVSLAMRFAGTFKQGYTAQGKIA
jgi:NAD-dependent SIR2 family protein deacetylase